MSLEDVAAATAKCIASTVLFGKSDKSGQPLYAHVERVAERCRNLSHEQYLAAILHDAIEDCQPEFAPENVCTAIRALFGHQVERLVLALTRRKDEAYETYLTRLSLNKEAIPIKLADLMDNLDPCRPDFSGREALTVRYRRAYKYLQSTL